MKKISIAALFLLISSIAFSANLTNQDIQSLISVENTLNSMCRGGRGDDPDTGKGMAMPETKHSKSSTALAGATEKRIRPHTR